MINYNVSRTPLQSRSRLILYHFWAVPPIRSFSEHNGQTRAAIHAATRSPFMRCPKQNSIQFELCNIRNRARYGVQFECAFDRLWYFTQASPPPPPDDHFQVNQTCIGYSICRKSSRLSALLITVCCFQIARSCIFPLPLAPATGERLRATDRNAHMITLTLARVLRAIAEDRSFN